MLGLGVLFNSGAAGCLLALFVLSAIAIIHNPLVFNRTEEYVNIIVDKIFFREKFNEYMAAFKNLGLVGALWLVGSS